MELDKTLRALAHAHGLLVGAYAFASPELRHMAAIAQLQTAWSAYRRDTAQADFGREHVASLDDDHILLTHDPRRDALLLWLANHGAAEIAEAADVLVRAVGASQRFNVEELDLLAAAEDMFSLAASAPSSSVPSDGSCAPEADDPQAWVWRLEAAVAALHRDPAFAEGRGDEVTLATRGGRYRHFVAAQPGACWAANVALLSKAGPVKPLLAGALNRALFRVPLESSEILPRDGAVSGHDPEEASLFEALLASANAQQAIVWRLHSDLERGHAALIHLSKNARAEKAWHLLAALGAARRSQLTRALQLSRAGGDIQVAALAAARLAAPEIGGIVRVDAAR